MEKSKPPLSSFFRSTSQTFDDSVKSQVDLLFECDGGIEGDGIGNNGWVENADPFLTFGCRHLFGY
jgi:hypothetical protein